MPDATPEAPEFTYPPELTVYPSDNDPEPVIYGPSGEVLRWRQRPIGFRGTRASGAVQPPANPSPNGSSPEGGAL